jgi:hypothetical protein
MNVKIGDWVRFEKCGIIVIGVVQYIDSHPFILSSSSNSPEAITDIGRVTISKILESRE